VTPEPRFIQGIFSFAGKGLAYPVPLEPGAVYAVPLHKTAEFIYLRAGNASSELLSLTLTHDGAPMRLFPIGAQSSVHVPLAMVEKLASESQLEVLVCAPDGMTGALVLDIGLLEFPARST